MTLTSSRQARNTDGDAPDVVDVVSHNYSCSFGLINLNCGLSVRPSRLVVTLSFVQKKKSGALFVIVAYFC